MAYPKKPRETFDIEPATITIEYVINSLKHPNVETDLGKQGYCRQGNCFAKIVKYTGDLEKLICQVSKSGNGSLYAYVHESDVKKRKATATATKAAAKPKKLTVQEIKDLKAEGFTNADIKEMFTS